MKRPINKNGITIHSAADFEGMRKAGKLAAEILDMIGEYVRPGVTTGELDQICHDFMIANNSVPATLGYRGYPKSSCISLNHVVCHGIPGEKIPSATSKNSKRKDDTIIDGDILNIDVTCIVDGWYGDNSRMYVAGKAKPYAKRLIQVTHDALMLGIEQAKPGNTFGDIGAAISEYAHKHNLSVVRDFCGHGIGAVFHSAPNVVHFGRWGKGPVIEEGMFFTIEPMLNLGKYDCEVLADNWTAITVDRKLSAQFEHTIGITENGAEIFTESPKGLFDQVLKS